MPVINDNGFRYTDSTAETVRLAGAEDQAAYFTQKEIVDAAKPLDLNGDGYLNKAELNAGLQALIAARPGSGGVTRYPRGTTRHTPTWSAAPGTPYDDLPVYDRLTVLFERPGRMRDEVSTREVTARHIERTHAPGRGRSVDGILEDFQRIIEDFKRFNDETVGPVKMEELVKDDTVYGYRFNLIDGATTRIYDRRLRLLEEVIG